jgi:hypothetical protein
VAEWSERCRWVRAELQVLRLRPFDALRLLRAFAQDDRVWVEASGEGFYGVGAGEEKPVEGAEAGEGSIEGGEGGGVR